VEQVRCAHVFSCLCVKMALAVMIPLLLCSGSSSGCEWGCRCGVKAVVVSTEFAGSSLPSEGVACPRSEVQKLRALLADMRAR